MDRCAECGFEYDETQSSAAASTIIEGVGGIASTLTDGARDLRARKQPHTWSPLEYGCHVRDVLLVQRERVLAARRTNRPSFEPMGRDERVEHDGYKDQDPTDVARELRDAARLFANVLQRLAPEDWSRTVVYSYPKPWERSLRWVAVHTVHEVRHHTLDVNRQLA